MNFGGTIRMNKLGICVICGLVVLIIFYLTPREGANRILGPNQVVNLRRLLIASIEASEQGGREVFRTRNEPNLNEKSKGKTKEGAESLVTNADYRSHCVMFNGLKRIFPSLKIISEEKPSDNICQDTVPFEIDPIGNMGVDDLQDEEAEVSKLSVWIDPLDATQEYTENILDCVTTMVCIAKDGKPLIGVIHRPFAQDPKTTWAWINKGKSPHLKVIPLLNETKIVIVSRSHQGKVDKVVKSAFGENTNIIHEGGAGNKVLQVIGGNASAYVHITAISKWDICAGDAIITAVGGSMTNLNGEDINYSGWSSPVNEDGLLVTLGNPSDYLNKIKEARSNDN